VLCRGGGILIYKVGDSEGGWGEKGSRLLLGEAERESIYFSATRKEGQQKVVLNRKVVLNTKVGRVLKCGLIC